MIVWHEIERKDGKGTGKYYFRYIVEGNVHSDVVVAHSESGNFHERTPLLVKFQDMSQEWLGKLYKPVGKWGVVNDEVQFHLHRIYSNHLRNVRLKSL